MKSRMLLASLILSLSLPALAMRDGEDCPIEREPASASVQADKETPAIKQSDHESSLASEIKKKHDRQNREENNFEF